jgi:hypothetical protein
VNFCDRQWWRCWQNVGWLSLMFFSIKVEGSTKSINGLKRMLNKICWIVFNQILQRYMLPIGFPQSYMPLIGTALPGVLLLISFSRQRYICTASNQLRNKTEGMCSQLASLRGTCFQLASLRQTYCFQCRNGTVCKSVLYPA